MKDISKLSTKEIEEKIDTLSDRHKTLKVIIKDVKEPSAKEALEVQQINYKLMMDRLRRELSRRSTNDNRT